MGNPLYMRGVYERVEHHLANAIQGQEVSNFERFGDAFLVDSFHGLNFKFKLPQQLNPNSAIRIAISTIPANLIDAKTPEDISEGLENILASLKSLLAKRDLLEQRGYHGEFYQDEKTPLEEMGYNYTIPTETEEKIKRAIDDFLS